VAALATVLIIGIASLSALFVQSSFSVDELQTNLSGLQQQRDVLREEVAQASSPQRVMEWARARGCAPRSRRDLAAPAGGRRRRVTRPPAGGSSPC
jgi:cell division protein FtsL